MKKNLSCILSLTFFTLSVFAQTNPQVQPLPYAQNFNTLPHGSTVYPSGWQGWNLAAGASTSFRTTAPTGDLGLTANSSASTTAGGVHNFDSIIGFLQTGGLDPSVCLAINTTGRTNISVSYNVMTMRNPYNGTTNTRINEMTLQYRIGVSGNFTTLTGIEYQNNTTLQNSGTTGQNIQAKNMVLPSACNNMPVVQLRWAGRDMSGSGSRPSFAIDDINIAGCNISVKSISATNAACNGDSSGSAVVTVQTNPQTHLVSVSDFSFTPDSVNAVAGDTIYWIWAGGFHTTTSTTIPVSAAVWDKTLSASGDYYKYVVTEAGTYNYKCTPHEGMGMTGIIVVSSAPVPSYTYQWNTSPVQTANTATGLSAGTYTVTVFDQGGCSVSAAVTVNEPALLTGSISVTDVSCNAGNDGAVNLSVSGGTMPYTYSWSNTATTEDITGLTAGIYSVTITDSNGCIAISKDTVNEPAPVAASVSITVAPSLTVCSGTSVTFTASPVNGGSAPVYQWKLNGSNTGANSNTYINAALTNGDIISCEMTSSLSCVINSPAASNSLTVTVIPAVVPSVSITASAGTICSGASVTFTAASVNGGSSPSYQWILNGNNVGTNSAVYTNVSLTNNDTVLCKMTSGAACSSPSVAISNSVIINVVPVVTAGVSISASSNPVCTGDNVTFTASAVNGGSTPSYQWKLNGGNAGADNPVYVAASVANGDAVMCEMTSSLSCVTGSLAVSNTVTMSVTSTAVPAVTIAVSPTSTICQGNSVTFTATPADGGPSPVYQWKLNGSNTGTNSGTYVPSYFSNGDVVFCEMVSSLSCASVSPALSNTITLTVNPLTVVNAGPDVTVCYGQSITLSATSNPVPISCSWMPQSGLSGSTVCNPVALPSVNVSYTVSVIDVNGCSGADQVNVAVAQLPAASVSPASDTICAGESVILTASGGGIYSWGTGETASSVTVSPTMTSSYTVVVTDINGCTNTAFASVIVEQCTGNNSFFSGNPYISIFPNPFRDEVTIRLLFPVNDLHAEIKIYSIHGTLMWEAAVNAPEIQIAPALLLPGMYFIKATTPGGVYFNKLIRE